MGKRTQRRIDILVLIIFIMAAIAAIIPNPRASKVRLTHPLATRIVYNYKNSQQDAKQALHYINQLRQRYGRDALTFDPRVFALASARAEDMRKNSYLDHTNPITGTCPDNMKADFGLNPDEFLAENIIGNPEYVEDAFTKIELKPMTEVVDAWMKSRGHRNNLLSDKHVFGAAACYKNMCVFLGLNYSRFGAGCYTGEEGKRFWESAPKQPGEVDFQQ